VRCIFDYYMNFHIFQITVLFATLDMFMCVTNGSLLFHILIAFQTSRLVQVTVLCLGVQT
jgi:hypothetical protein